MITMLRIRIGIVVEPDDGGFYAYCPGLKGLHVDGATEEEAVQNAKDGVIAYLESLMKHGDPIPVNLIEFEKEFSFSKFFSSLFSKKPVQHIEEIVLNPA